MTESKSKKIEELDQELKELEQLIEKEMDQNLLIELRIQKKKLYLQKLELEQYREN